MQNNPVKPNTKIRILSPEHGEHIVGLAKEAGYKTALTATRGGIRRFAVFAYQPPFHQMILSDDEVAFNKSPCEEIHIPLPSEINSRILAEKVTAAQILEAGLGHMRDRAVTYDNESGERSMSATVEAFNAITGHQLTEEQGWHFMTLLKIVRSQQGVTKLDNYEDGAAYFGLAGEAAMRGAK